MMKHLNGSRMVQVAACLALLVFIGCTGKKGPTGPMGSTGPKGDKGDPGTTSRVLYTGTVPAGVDSFFVAIPSMNLANPALVSTFVQVSPAEYDELPFIFQFAGETTVTQMYASIRDGGVTLWFCRGLNYIIIVIR